MSSFVIKLIAIISMVFDHSGDLFVGHLSIFNLIGRIAFPLFCFQLVVGYTYTKDLKKYIVRMFIFALISQIPYSFFMHAFQGTYFALNIFFTLATSLICIYILNSKKMNTLLKFLCILTFSIISYFLKFDFAVTGILYSLFIYIFYPFQNLFGKNSFNFHNLSIENYDKNEIKKSRFNFKAPLFNFNKCIFVLGTIIFSIIQYAKYFPYLNFGWIFGLIFFSSIPCVFMLMFNGKKGPSFKYFFYAFYPLHLTILYIFYLLIKV